MHDELDVRFQGMEHALCCHRVDDVLVDPGPGSCLPALLDALGGFVPRAILLTHIHLDHAGAAGALAQRWPGVEVWVHERGARHLADPSKLLASATRIYGDDMERLWGTIVPVPEDRLVVLAGGERRDGFRVAYTPGHAVHHVAYLHEDTGLALAGDVAGVRIDDGPTMPPTPPPDIDLELWEQSVDLVAAWDPAALAITHFGTFSDVAAQLAAVKEGLHRWGELAREVGRERFEAIVRRTLRDRPAYEAAMPPETLFAGLDRYWQRRESPIS